MLERLLADLVSEGTVLRAGPREGVYIMTSYCGRPLDQETLLTLTSMEFCEHLQSMLSGDPQDVSPDSEPIEAAYKLFLTHLDEEMDRYDLRVSSLRVSHGQLIAAPHGDISGPIPIDWTGEVLHWSANPPSEVDTEADSS